MTAPRSAAGEYLRFLSWAVAVTIAVALLGYVPTRRLGGEEALLGMVVGCGIGLVASVVGALPLALAYNSRPETRRQAFHLSMGLRLVLVLVLMLAAALSGRLERESLLVWVAIGYGALLVVDTWYGIRVLAAGQRPEKSSETA